MRGASTKRLKGCGHSRTLGGKDKRPETTIKKTFRLQEINLREGDVKYGHVYITLKGIMLHGDNKCFMYCHLLLHENTLS